MKRCTWWRMEQDAHHLSPALCGAFCSILHHVKRFISQPPHCWKSKMTTRTTRERRADLFSLSCVKKLPRKFKHAKSRNERGAPADYSRIFSENQFASSLPASKESCEKITRVLSHFCIWKTLYFKRYFSTIFFNMYDFLISCGCISVSWVRSHRRGRG